MPVHVADPAPVYLHSSQQSAAIRGARLDSLKLGRIHHAFHYNSVRQTELWLDVFRRHSPVVGNPEFGRIYRQCFENLAAQLVAAAAGSGSGPGEVHVIGLGSGDGTKEAWLLEVLAAHGVATRFTAIDVSAELALIAARNAARYLPDRAPSPTALVCDLLSFAGPDLAAWLNGTGALRLFTFFGLFPNFEPDSVFPWLRSLLRPSDILLASAHLAPTAPGDESRDAYAAGCKVVLPQYDNDTTRAWLGTVLQDWGWASHLGPLQYATEPLGDLLRFRVTAKWRSDMTLAWQGEEIAVRRDEPLQIFYSIRYTPGRFEETARRYGLNALLQQLTSCREEGIWKLEPEN
ncbi:MAG: hypothetical protein ACAI35_09885 [Candidatus Methylacidiphilales bacterium]